MTLFTAPAFFSGLVLSLSLIMAIGPQNAHVMRMGLKREHLWLTIAVCVATDILLIATGVIGLAQMGGLSDKLLGAMTGAGALVLLLYGAQALRRFLQPEAAPGGLAPSGAGAGMSRRQAIGAALATGSLLWFTALGLAMASVGRHLDSPRIWRALDGLVALMMGGTALWLLAGLFR